MADSPLVSVLIPTYNYGEFLPQALDSVLAQDFPHYEVVVVDDASTDSTAEVLARYRGRDRRLRLEANPANLGMVGNWHRCLSLARGKYVKFMLGDDYFLTPDALSRMVAVMEAHPGVSLVACGRLVVDEAGRGLKMWSHFPDGALLPGPEVIRRCLVKGINFVGEPTAVLYRKEQGARGFDPSFRQIIDLEMWLHLLERGDFGYLAQPLVAYRQHPRQQTKVNRSSGVTLDEWQRLFDLYADRPYLRIPPFQRWYFAINQVYAARRQARRGAAPAEAAQTMTASYGWARYLLGFPVYRVARSYYKARRWLARRGSLTTPVSPPTLPAPPASP